MMCYRDRTWCTEKGCRHFGKSCSRSYTEEVERSANEWARGAKLPHTPVAFFVDTPQCFESKEDA